jgi:membrane protease subunit HflK
MARGNWGEGPIDIGGNRVQLPRLPKLPAGMLRLGVIVVAVLFLLFTSYYQVEPEEVGVIQRFGAYVRTTAPPEAQAESLMLTGDLNVAVVEWIVQFRIRDPKAFLFHVRDVPETFRYMSEAAVRQIVGDHSVDEVITIGRAEIALAAKEELQRLCDLYGIGIEIQQLVLQDVNPPDPVRPAFNEVNQAIQEKERSINEAWADYNQAVPRAQGEAEQMVRAAEGYALERENRALGDARRFEAVYTEYRKAPDVTRKRMYLETMADLLPELGQKVILDEKARGVLPLLQLDGRVKEVTQ